MAEFRHKALTQQLLGLIFKTRNQLLSGWPEEVFHQALTDVFVKNQVFFASKPRRSLLHRSAEIHVFEPDLVVEDLLILELKVLRYGQDFASGHYAQLINYLKFWGRDLGLLINFAPPRVKVKRVLWDEPELKIVENYDDIRSFLSDEDKDCLREIRHHIIGLGKQYGLGYADTIIRKLLAVELAYHGIDCVSDVKVEPHWHGKQLPIHTTQHLLVNGRYLIHICSLRQGPTTYDFHSTMTYLRCLGLTFGLVVNFGKKELQIYGVMTK